MSDNSFYNTIRERGRQLAQSEAHAVSQEAWIFLHFKANPQYTYTPFDIQREMPELSHVPITSIRRAITNLTMQGLLEQTHEMRQGEYGKMNHTWRYRQQHKQGEQLRLF